VLCGPGNNGGDGFVATRLLRQSGWPVRLGLLGELGALRGDAAAMAERWSGGIAPLDLRLLDGDPLVVDALFGSGLARAVEGMAAQLIDEINRRHLDCLAVDVPSGLNGDDGQIQGVAPRCRATVTFFTAKPGHWLLPGRELCGELDIADIGIPPVVLDGIRPQAFHNDPGLWLRHWPRPGADSHKYRRGHALVLGGPMTGAGRLAAEAARRIGAGLVTIACAPDDRLIYASGRPGSIIAPLDSGRDYARLVAEPRYTALLLGPGAGCSGQTRAAVEAALATGKPAVVDADGLSVFADAPEALFAAIAGPCVLTPHEGEFRRIFAVHGSKLARARQASRQSGAVVLLKGADTVVAAPDGRACINTNAPPDLATAGSGDVLAGLIAGLLAQGLPAFEAAAAACWSHGRAAARFGAGLIAEDLIDGLPAVLADLQR
jgi:NAD(P)H-hydrate epimerase